ncbi:MAG TPA: LacI family DNA-binding transcriptional regulator [Symbiobacteriaceae bacterium]
MKRWSMREIARRAGVSPATVSRVMNGQGNVSPELAERVRAVLRSMQREQRSGTALPNRIGIAIPRRLEGYGMVGDSFYGEVLSAIDKVMREEGHELALCPYDPEEPFDVLLNETFSRYDGLILLGADTPDQLAREGVQRKLPVVVIDKHVHGVDSVVSDNVGGAEAVTCFVLSRGYQNLAYLCETLDDASFAARARGFSQAIAASGRTDLRYEICEVGRGWLKAQQVLDHLIATYPFPLAIVAGNDMTALHILALARAKGIAVPSELGLVGFDDVPLASMAEPALTTVRVDKAEMGRLAAQRLLERLTRPDLTPVTAMMHVSLVVRASTA